MTVTSVRRVGNLTLLLALVLGISGLAVTVPASHASNASEYGIAHFSASLSTSQAGAHPDFTTELELKTDPSGKAVEGIKPPYARTKDINISIPPGLLGNIGNFPKCTIAQFGTDPSASHCPVDSQIGFTEVLVWNLNRFHEPVFLIEAPEGSDVVARIGFMAGLYPVVLNIRVRPEDDYGIEASVEGANSIGRLVAATTTLWGVPTAEVHDSERVTTSEAYNGELPPGGGRSSGLAPAAFMTNPTQCGVVQTLSAATDSYQLPGVFSTAEASLPPITGCGGLSFQPSISLTPTTGSAGSPSGIDADISLPQEGLRNPAVLATPHLRSATVELPPGMTLNPAAAVGLEACSEQQIGLVSDAPVRFDGSSAECPSGSKVGTAEITTPVLPEPLQGSLYLATQVANPFQSLLAGYLVAEGQGVVLKVAGRFHVSPTNGAITAFFEENPQQPFEDLKLHFKSGANSVLTTPPTCGTYSIFSQFISWASGLPSNHASQFNLTSGPSGGACPSGTFAPTLSAGTVNPTAGAYSPFTLDLSRADGTQRLGGLTLQLPKGLTGKLAGIPYCGDPAIEAAAAMSQLGQGAVQLASPSCPAQSQIGTVRAGAGSGPNPFYVNTGRVYLAGPYKGAPISMAIVTPAIAGPFDLGNVVVRAALQVDPTTAQVTAVSDPLPTILDGIPLDLRDVRVDLGRPDFVLNPTSCEPMEFTGTASGEGGAQAPVSDRFQAASCASLDFKPKLSIALKGATRRTGHPALKATFTYPKKGAYANIAKAQVALPHSEFLDQGNIGKTCTKPVLLAHACPPKSIYGKAKAWTPLLEKPLEGPVYLVGGYGYKLPALVAELNGQIRVLLVGKVDTGRNKGIRNTFEAVPDAPVEKFVLEMKGGKRFGLLQNSEDICKRTQRAEATFDAQNGDSARLGPKITSQCGKKKGKQGA